MTAHFIPFIFSLLTNLLSTFISYIIVTVRFSFDSVEYWVFCLIYLPHCLTVERICPINKMDFGFGCLLCFLPLDGMQKWLQRNGVKVEWLLIVAQFVVSCGKVDKWCWRYSNFLDLTQVCRTWLQIWKTARHSVGGLSVMSWWAWQLFNSFVAETITKLASARHCFTCIMSTSPPSPIPIT